MKYQAVITFEDNIGSSTAEIKKALLLEMYEMEFDNVKVSIRQAERKNDKPRKSTA